MQPIKTTKFIFDLDGTLYRFKEAGTFDSSAFGARIKQNIHKFLQAEAGVPADLVQETYDLWNRKHGGMSLAVERERGIDRVRFFQATWDLDPAEFIVSSDEPRRALERLPGRFAVLTAAPRVWAEAALRFLNVRDLVGDALFTGEPDLRKPSPDAFAQVGKFLGVPFDRICSVGDQEESDILPPRSIGMRTIRVGGEDTVADDRIADISKFLGLPSVSRVL